ncbi:MAG: hypothetical protein M1484_03890 [Patescibacteria group bacterium]|nr:hypothetical protein [Patescibacteria group bacterium]MCL5432203.1 hypothetical protein [Patescibacteria group bacterium]
MSYLQWLEIFFGIPIILFLLVDYHIFWDHRKIFLRIWIGSFIFAFPWDILAVARKAWEFPQGLIGINIINLPIEEFVWGAMFTVIVCYLTILLVKQQGKYV